MILTTQHNEYKLPVVYGLLWLQYALFGPVNFRFICLFADFLLLPVAFCLWKLFLPGSRDLQTKLILFFPVACLWFQLNAVESIWGLTGYQSMFVLLFVLGGIHLLLRKTQAAYLGALLCLVGAICSNGNGFLLVAVGGILLLRQRRLAALGGWLAVTAACVAGYAYHYQIERYPPTAHQPLLLRVLHGLLYFVTFLGNAASVRPLCPLLGAGLCVFWVWMERRGYFRRNEATLYCLLFIVLTAVMVMFGRSDGGLWTSIDSRYRFYSDLLLIFSWGAFVEEFLPDRGMALLENRRFRLAAALALIFAIGMDAQGFRYLWHRGRVSLAGMHRFEHPTPADPYPTPIPPEPVQSPAIVGFDIHARQVLIEAMRLGTYEPPPL